MSDPKRQRALSRPWILWIQTLRDDSLFLLIYKPRYRFFLRFFGRWRRTTLHHHDGPVKFSSPKEQSEWVELMIDAGKTHIPDGQRFKTSLSLADTQEIVDETWRPKSLSSF